MKSLSPKFCVVYRHDMIVLDDYINSFGDIIVKRIEYCEFNVNKFIESEHIYIFTQMWLELDGFNETVLKSPRFVFLNVEMLTEQSRIDHIIEFLKRDIQVIDYSEANINWMYKAIKHYRINYSKKILWFPYQFNKKENDILTLPLNSENEYEYDIGMINAYVKPDSSVDSSNTYRRNDIWELLKNHSNIKALNIMGWGNDRDKQINKCRIILNIHHFQCFRIFENIRCDRLIFANKFIISDRSDYENELDIADFVLKVDYDNIIDTVLKYCSQDNGVSNNKLKKRNFFTENKTEKLDNIIKTRKHIMEYNLKYLSNLLK